MNLSKAEESTPNAEQSTPKQFLQRFLQSYLLIGPGENVLTNLACINTVCLLFVFWFVLITSLLYTPLIRNKIELELNVCEENPEGSWISKCESVESITNRIGFTLSVTFISLALISLPRHPENVHQGFWLAKFLLILILLPISFMIPVGHFDFVWSIICFVGSLVFYFIEIVLILDFATTASDTFVTKITQERSKLWYLVWLVLNWIIYSLAVVSTLLLYAFHTDNCGLSAILVTVVSVVCVLFTLLAVYFSKKRTGLLHSGLCTLYIVLLTLVTLNHEGFCEDPTTDMQSGVELSHKVLNHFEIVLGLLLLTYAALRNFNEKYYHISGLTTSRQLIARRMTGSVEEGSLNSQKEVDTPVFSASAFFAMFGFFAFFVTSKLTSLRTAKYTEPTIGESTTFHVRSLTILLLLIFITWSHVYPALYPNENPFDLWALGKTFFKSQLKLCHRILIDGCEWCNGPVASRIIFTALYILGVLFSCLLYIPEIRHSLSKSTYFCATISTRGVCLSTDPAYMAVYRVCFAMATFYLLFAVILVCVDNPQDPREGYIHTSDEDNTHNPRVDLQYKAWPVKICLFCSLLLASFLLPNEFSRVWIYTALTGTFLFTILQLILLIYWTETTTTRLQGKIESSNSGIWAILLIFLTFFMIILSLTAVIMFYIFFTKLSRCLTNTVFITLNLVLIVTTSLISVHPKIYNAGLLQCFVIVIFSLYLTWSGLSHNPDEECNPVAGYIAEVDMRPNLNIQAGLDLVFTFVTVIYFSSKAPYISESIRSAYDTLRSICNSSRKRETSFVTMSVIESQATMSYPAYNFTFFHAVYFLASLHATIILTNWFIPTSGSRFKLSVNWAAMCIKMTSSNLSLVLYVWVISAHLFTQ